MTADVDSFPWVRWICLRLSALLIPLRVGERNLAKREVKLLKMTEGRTVTLDTPATAASGDSDDSIDRLFDEEHDVKKRKRKVVGDASGSVYPPKKLRDDHQSLPPNTSGKSLATLRGMISEGSDLPSGATEPLIVASLAPMSDVGPVDSVSGLNLRTLPPHVRYVVSSDGSHHSDSYSEATSFARSLVADAPVVTVAITTTADANVAASSKVRDVSKDFKNIGDYASVGGVNADAASISKLKKTFASTDSSFASQSLETETMHRACLGAEVRMRAEHTLEKKVEIADAAKSTKLRDLKEKNFALEG
ncbi:hypothetical protein Tco_0833664, partial [Tanacetum coccineum]